MLRIHKIQILCGFLLTIFLFFNMKSVNAVNVEEMVPMCRKWADSGFSVGNRNDYEAIACASYVAAVIELSSSICNLHEQDTSKLAMDIKKKFATKATPKDIPNIITFWLSFMEKNPSFMEKKSPSFMISHISSLLKPC